MAKPPEEYFGFQLVSDRKIARWDQIIDYFRLGCWRGRATR